MPGYDSPNIAEERGMPQGFPPVVERWLTHPLSPYVALHYSTPRMGDVGVLRVVWVEVLQDEAGLRQYWRSVRWACERGVLPMDATTRALPVWLQAMIEGLLAEVRDAEKEG